MKDYSEYLNIPGMLAWIEQEWQKNKHVHQQQAAIVDNVVAKYNLLAVLEVGCSTGNTASYLKNAKFYIGIDKNEEAVNRAIQKNPDLVFFHRDVRTYKNYYDLAFSFAFLKHFSLDEWDEIFKRLSSFGKYLIFDMPCGELKDDGVEFHHVWMPVKEVERRIEAAGLELIEILNVGSVEPVYICKRK